MGAEESQVNFILVDERLIVQSRAMMSVCLVRPEPERVHELVYLSDLLRLFWIDAGRRRGLVVNHSVWRHSSRSVGISGRRCRG